jgi:hypothetical protein
MANPGDRVLVFLENLPRVAVGEVVESNERMARLRMLDRHCTLTENSESFRSADLKLLSDYPRKELSPGMLFRKGEVVLQFVGGIFQLGEILQDVKNGDALAMLRLHVGSHGNITGVTTPTQVDIIMRPADFLNDR